MPRSYNSGRETFTLISSSRLFIDSNPIQCDVTGAGIPLCSHHHPKTAEEMAGRKCIIFIYPTDLWFVLNSLIRTNS